MDLSLRAVLLLLAVFLPVELDAQANTSAADQVARLVARYDSAWNGRDFLIVNRLLAPNYQYFTSRGEISSRAEAMKFLADPAYLLEQAHRSEVVVKLSGPVAVVSSRWAGQGIYRGERFVDDQRCGQTWVRTGRDWQLLNEHCVQIALALPASTDSPSP